MNFNEIINLCESENGKIFVVSESGEVKLVILLIAEYQRLALGKLKREVKNSLDVEKVNTEITRAQMQESEAGQSETTEVAKNQYTGSSVRSRLQDSSISAKIARVDMREEVIDPSFDFEAPKVEIEDI